MLRNILVGLDDSPYRENVVELGIRWAERLDATLTLLGIVDEPAICRREPVPPGAIAFKKEADEQQMADAQNKVLEWLHEAGELATSRGARHHSLSAEGDPENVILREAQRADALLLGHRTHFRFATQDGPCETLSRVLHHSPRPVVTVPASLPDSKTVVVAYDGSLQAACAVQQFAQSGLGAGVPVHVVSISEDSREAKEIASRAVEFLAHHAIQAQMHAIASDSIATAVLQSAEDLSAGLIVLGAYGKSKLHDFFLGSVTKTILNEATRPLFVYH